MKRDMALICVLLRYAEQAAEIRRLPAPRVEGYTDGQVYYHIGLCVQAGYLTATPPVTNLRGELHYQTVGQLTWQGQEALENLCPQLSAPVGP